MKTLFSELNAEKSQNDCQLGLSTQHQAVKQVRQYKIRTVDSRAPLAAAKRTECQTSCPRHDGSRGPRQLRSRNGTGLPFSHSI